MTLLNIPSPSISQFSIGPLTIHIYALCILVGIALAWWLGGRRVRERGGNQDEFETITLMAVIMGIIGARIYHVITDYQLYFGPGRNPVDALKIWNGGLGIWGAIMLGGATVWLLTKRKRIDTGAFADAMAPGIIFAQGIGRLGNWFNQELFGRPTTLPWGLEIDAAHRPAGYESFATFHPTFLYELIWNVIGGFVLIWAEKRFKLGHGRVFWLYVVWYTFGRFFIEAVRIDPVNTIGGFRVNNYVSVITFVIALGIFIWLSKTRPGQPDKPLAKPDEPAEVVADDEEPVEA